MPGSLTTPRDQRTRDTARGPVAFRSSQGVGCSGFGFFVAQWLAYALPCRRFDATLADGNARLGADVGRYSFIVMDFHHILLAGLPAHAKQSIGPHKERMDCFVASARNDDEFTLQTAPR
jgi:hypothetical protein